MTGVVLDENGRAAIFNRVSGQTLVCAVPTALENVKLGGGVWVHGTTGDPWTGAEVAGFVVAPVEVILLHEEDTLPLPAADGPAVEPEVVTTEAPVHPLDHDANGKKGGSKPNRSTDPEREAIKKALNEKGVKFFGGTSTEKLKELLAAS